MIAMCFFKNQVDHIYCNTEYTGFYTVKVTRFQFVFFHPLKTYYVISGILKKKELANFFFGPNSGFSMLLTTQIS